MKATFTINQLEFELNADSARDLFQQVAQIQEIFEAETQCGCCQSEEIRYSYREVDQYKFYELVCGECSAQFRFGQKKVTLDLFPKRTEDGKPLPNHGWSKYEPKDGDDTRSRPRSSQQAARPVSAPRPENGGAIAEYPDWDAAEKDANFGKKPLRVGGVLWSIDPKRKEYVEAPQHAQAR
jgi:hypothetical protein